MDFVWEDDRKFEIDKVIEWKKAASIKGDDHGIRFLCSQKERS